MDEDFIYMPDDGDDDFVALAREIMQYTNYTMDQLELMTAEALDEAFLEYARNKSARKNQLPIH